MSLAGCFGQRVVQLVAVGVGVVALEGRVVPVAVECREELLQQGRRGHGGQAHVPLDAIEHRCAGEVAGADVGRVEAGVAPEEPRLRVESRSLRVVLDLDLGPEVPHEPIQGGPLGGSHVGRRDQAEGDATLARCLESVLEEAQAVPLDEGHDDVDPVGTRQLGSNLVADSWLTGRVGEERGIREWRGRTLTKRTDHGAGYGRHRNSEELPSGGERVVRSPQLAHESVDQGQPTPRVPLLAQGSQGDITDVPRQNVRLVGLVDHSPLNIEARETRQALLEGARDQTLVQPLEQAFVPVAHLTQLARLGHAISSSLRIQPGFLDSSPHASRSGRRTLETVGSGRRESLGHRQEVLTTGCASNPNATT